MAYSTISKPSLYFNTKLYTGNATTDTAQTGVGFQPDWLWIKERGGTGANILVDAVRGVSASSTPFLKTNTNGVEVSNNTNDFIKSLDSDGFTLGADSYFTDVNKNSSTYVAWNWKANGAGSANTDGSINSTVSVNSIGGFSIVSWTGNQSANTVGHGLGVVPSLIIVKSLASADAWYVYHKKLGATKSLFLDLTNAESTSSTYWNDTAPTSSVFSVNNNTGTNNTGGMIAYCFAEKKGFSKFGSYTGNGSTDGTFVYTGFKPAWIMYKASSISAQSWLIHDNKRGNQGANANPQDLRLLANATNSEADVDIDFLSNGFKPRAGDTHINNHGTTYIYMAFAEEPLVANVGASIPATAR